MRKCTVIAGLFRTKSRNTETAWRRHVFELFHRHRAEQEGGKLALVHRFGLGGAFIVLALAAAALLFVARLVRWRGCSCGCSLRALFLARLVPDAAVGRGCFGAAGAGASAMAALAALVSTSRLRASARCRDLVVEFAAGRAAVAMALVLVAAAAAAARGRHGHVRRGGGLRSSRTSMSIISRRASLLPVIFSIASIYLPSRERGQHEGRAAAAGAAGAADAVDIIVGMDRHVEIEDMADGGHVQPARRDIAGDQDLEFAGAETVQRLGAQRLVEIAMDRRGVEAVLDQRLGHDIDIALAVAEDDGVVAASVRLRGSGGAALRAWPSHWPGSSPVPG